MKRKKMLVGLLALVVAAGTAYAFTVNEALPGNLYYYNDLGNCVRAPCETTNNSNDPCQNTPLYTAAGCGTVHGRGAWTKIGGK